MPNHRAQDVLEFWFGIGADYGKRHKRWFEKDAAFDAEIAGRFLPLYEELAQTLTSKVPRARSISSAKAAADRSGGSIDTTFSIASNQNFR